MSPASKYKPKFKKAGKEPQNTSMKLQGNANSSNGGPANAYNPLLGTFHMLDAVPEFSAPSLQVNSRFRTIDDTDDPSGTSLTGPEYDSVSNNGSWSGESEDHRDKPPAPATRQEAIPGADNDKREKIRQKNERKHRRQKERRAHELHERCCGYLMSRKLEGLAQKLVAMGFSSERAMMALILNEGKLEESVTWLFEGHDEEEDKHDDRDNLKLDISKELSRIDDMEVKYGCSKQEVERAIVACEGDLRKAVESLKMQKPEENGDPPKNEESRGSSDAKHQLKDELTNHGKVDFGSKNGPPLPLPLPPKKFQSKPEVRELAMDKTSRWLGGSSILASSPPVQVSTAVPAGMVREPVVMMQRPKPFATTEQTPTTSNGMLQMRSLSPNRLRLNQLYLQNHHHHHDLQNHHHHHHHHHQSHQQSFNPVPTVAPASSLGLFSGLGSGGRVLGSSPSPVDWSTGSSSSSLDYSSIDWSLDRGLSSQKPNGLWLGLDPSRRFPTTVMSGPVPVPVSQSGGEADACADRPAEWTTPFEGQDLLSVPRRFVSSPPL